MWKTILDNSHLWWHIWRGSLRIKGDKKKTLKPFLNPMVCSVPVAQPETRLTLALWDQCPHQYGAGDLCLSVSLATLLIISYSSKHADTVIGTIHSGDLCLCLCSRIYLTYLSVLVCACDVVIWSQEKKSPTAVCLFVCVSPDPVIRLQVTLI